MAMRSAARIIRGYSTEAPLRKTALYDFHVARGGKMVPFAGWSMPVQYADLGILQSHLHTRQNASIFDVSHMLQTKLHGKDRIAFIESLVVSDIGTLDISRSQLSVFTNEAGGSKDDTVISKFHDHLYVVSNAGCSDKILSHLGEHLNAWKKNGKDVSLEILDRSALIALQGPKAVAALSKFVKADFAAVPFMSGFDAEFLGAGNASVHVHVTRCGYTGEDGFEISIPAEHAVAVTEALLSVPDVKLAGLGPRDSLRLEAALNLYGHELNEDISPVEGGISWTISKNTRGDRKFLGSEIIYKQLKEGVKSRRIGLTVEGAPAREGTVIYDEKAEREVGRITSGGPSPVLKKNIALGFLDSGIKRGAKLTVKVRGKVQAAEVVKTPFVPAGYKSK